MRPDGGAGARLALRAATPADATAIADLHARSWQASYRGSLSDAYLDGPVEAERAAFWRARLAMAAPEVATLLLEDGEAGLVGFVCACLADHPRWGTRVDNLHVDPARKGGGFGRRLLRAMGAHLVAVGSADPVYLFVLASNVAAQGFYHRLGGMVVERLMADEPDGRRHPVERIAWPNLAAFVEGAA